MAYKKIVYKGKLVKLEVFNKGHKLAKSLPVHKRALEANLNVPQLYKVEERNNKIYKYTEWISGNTIQYEMDNNINLIEPICMDLAKYINELRNVSGISPVDNHFENFVWNNNSVIYIDLKKLFINEPYDYHIIRMSKICLKSCRADRRKAFYFLKGYAKYRDVKPIIEDCDKRKWKWTNIKGSILKIDPIKLEELM